MPRRLHRFAISLGLCASVLLSGWAAHWVSSQVGLADLQATGQHRLDLYATSLEREIGKFAFLPGTLALEGNAVELLVHPDSRVQQQRVNTYLEQLNTRAGTLAIYLLSREGRVLASSNWRRPDSFVGEDLSFRAYFRDALSAGSGRFFGIGTTRGEPGYYLAASLPGEPGGLGVAVIKVGLDELEKSWSTVETPALVSDENGVIILSAVPDWKFATLRPLDEATRRAFDRTLQYNRRALKPLGMHELRRLDDGARLVRIEPDGPQNASIYPTSGPFLAQSRPLPGTPWTLTVLSHSDQVDDLARSWALIGGVGAICLCLIALMLQERRRRLRDRLAAREALQRAHDELERKVEARTADLSTANQALQDEVAERIRAERTLRDAQDELVQAGKLAVIGQLSTGIAHELNQPLAALRTLSGNSVRFLARGDLGTTRDNLTRIGQLVDRMGAITGQLRDFARKSSGQAQAVSLSQALDNALALLDSRLRHSRATVCRQGEAPPVWCDPNRLEQVLVNLLGNALDAMDGQTAPAIELSLDTHESRARLQVRDHGPGISPEALDQLFKPFFTTKPVGRGLGLGLAISAGIVRDFGAASLTAHNHADGGAVFVLELPFRDPPHD